MLAKELGVTSKEVLMKLSEWGHFVKSASSTLEAPLVRRLREEFRSGTTALIDAQDYGHAADIRRPIASDDGGFGAALRKAQRQSNSGSATGRRLRRQRDEPLAPIVKAVLDFVIVAQRPAHAVRTDGSDTRQEIDRAKPIAMQWAQAWMTGHTDNESNVVDWIRVARGERPDIAAKLSNAGLTPADTELRLGFGRIDESRDTIIARVIKGNLGIRDAIRQVQEYRRSQRPTAS